MFCNCGDVRSHGYRYGYSYTQSVHNCISSSCWNAVCVCVCVAYKCSGVFTHLNIVRTHVHLIQRQEVKVKEKMSKMKETSKDLMKGFIGLFGRDGRIVRLSFDAIHFLWVMNSKVV